MTDQPTIPTPAGGVPVAPQPPAPPAPSADQPSSGALGVLSATEGLLTTVTSAEPGWQTTEFWSTLAVQLIGLLTLTGVIHPAQATVDTIVGIIGVVVPAVVYAISRGIRKAGTPA